MLRSVLLISLLFISVFVKAQKIENIFVNLYTDSLKKGTFNYINIDGQLSDGSYLPLDSTHLIFWSSDGKFSGNSLWIDKNFKHEKVVIKVIARKNYHLNKEFTIYIKKKPEDEKLLTDDEIMDQMKSDTKKKRKKI